MLARGLAELVLEVGYQETVTRVLPLMGYFVADVEASVRHTMAEQLYPLALFLIEVAVPTLSPPNPPNPSPVFSTMKSARE